MTRLRLVVDVNVVTSAFLRMEPRRDLLLYGPACWRTVGRERATVCINGS